MLTFEVRGLPAPQGSKTAVANGGRVRVIEGGSTSGRIKHRAWRTAVLQAATLEARRADLGGPITGPVAVVVVFRFHRPKSTPARYAFKATRPDLDKLVRSTLDSLTDAQVIEDDARVVHLVATKSFVNADEWTGAYVTVRSLQDGCA